MSNTVTKRGIILLPHGQITVLAERCGVSTVTATKYLRGVLPTWSRMYAQQEKVRQYALENCGGTYSKNI